MEIKDIKDLIDKINDSDLALFEMNLDGIYLKMDKSLNRSSGEPKATEEKIKIDSNKSIEQSNNSNTETKTIEKELIEDSNVEKIKSPMVGTFYGASAPGKSPFVKEGDSIKKGQTLCIIEAMKLMNEIQAEHEGIISKVLVKDGDMVEFGKPLFEIKGA